MLRQQGSRLTLRCGLALQRCRQKPWKLTPRTQHTTSVVVQPNVEVSKKLFSQHDVVDPDGRREAIFLEDAALLGIGHAVDLRHEWKFDNQFYWFGLGTGISSYCLTVGALHCATGFDLILLASIYGNFLFHELGHAEACRRLGCSVECIVVQPLGGGVYHGVTMNAWQNAVISLAGPAAGFTHAALCGVGAHLLDSSSLWAVASLGSWMNGLNLWPFETRHGQKSDGFYVLDAIRKKEVCSEEWLEYGNEFPENFYKLTMEQRTSLLIGYSALAMANISLYVYCLHL